LSLDSTGLASVATIGLEYQNAGYFSTKRTAHLVAISMDGISSGGINATFSSNSWKDFLIWKTRALCWCAPWFASKPKIWHSCDKVWFSKWATGNRSLRSLIVTVEVRRGALGLYAGGICLPLRNPHVSKASHQSLYTKGYWRIRILFESYGGILAVARAIWIGDL